MTRVYIEVLRHNFFIAKISFRSFKSDMNTTIQQNISFQGKCPELELGRKICHVINVNYPHISLSRLNPAFEKLELKKIINPSYLESVNMVSIRNIIRKFEDSRVNFMFDSVEYANKVVNFLKNTRKGNCSENAFLAQLILKLNGFKDVYRCSLSKNKYKVDHVVCIFNRDGSEYNGAIKNNQTIILDPWAGICEFANKAFKIYENQFRNSFAIPAKGHFYFRNIIEMNFTNRQLETLREKYPNLIF